ncbi:hypothetical protein QF026_008278 [Streptomyces aurantiacus]|uniref:hypothetical protein n=1 Tax=Streptomyces aurantiacus TaxID=47760 RepID=UPI00278E4F04|nr:hypothetical protein [Streptomyces aurantiacus]MDQ0779812.1 hypothetical protein [Streptomyces aurantiacus]
MTAAARLARPRLQRTDDGDWIDDLMGATDQADWAEPVTLALAGAAANFGGVEEILAGRSGTTWAGGADAHATRTAPSTAEEDLGCVRAPTDLFVSSVGVVGGW